MSPGYKLTETYRGLTDISYLRSIDRLISARLRLPRLNPKKAKEIYLAKTNDIIARRIMYLSKNNNVTINGVEDGLALYENNLHSIRHPSRVNMRSKIYGGMSNPVDVMCTNQELNSVYVTHPGFVRNEVSNKKLYKIEFSITNEQVSLLRRSFMSQENDLHWDKIGAFVILPHSNVFHSERQMKKFESTIYSQVSAHPFLAVSYHPRETNPYLDANQKDLTVLPNEIPAEIAMVCMRNLKLAIGGASTALKSATLLRDDIQTICITVEPKKSRFETHVAPNIFDEVV